jgi:transmembrane sensor
MQDEIKSILKKGKAENASEKDRQEMLALFHQLQYEYCIKGIIQDELEDTSSAEMPAIRLKIMFSNFWKLVEGESSVQMVRRRYLKTFLKIAAALAVGLFIGIYISYLINKQEPLYYTAHSPKGSVSEWILPDGTQIFLNADTRIRYKSESRKETREVFLEGEAWFDVKKDKKRPFIVHTDPYDIYVTGTRFNVKAYENDKEIVTTLEEGEIILAFSDNAKPGKNVIMKPGEQAILEKQSDNPDIKEVNPRWFTAWKDNKLVFMNMKLKELIVLIERKYGVDIIVKDARILSYHCDGTFKNETIIEILEIIKKILPINYEIVGQHIEITAN